MIRIPAGAFLMGSPVGEPRRSTDELQHFVKLTKDFYIGKYEITQAHYEAVTGENPSFFLNQPNYPVERVNWYDCVEFCNRLSEIKGYKTVYNLGILSADWSADGFRLPTEAEWEYACRSGAPTAFYWGEDSNYTEIDLYAWYDLNSNGRLHEIGLKRPNAWGLFDISGNVWEWCHDWYGLYDVNDATDPRGMAAGDIRVWRGGNWGDEAMYCRSASRDGWKPQSADQYLGFRIVRTAESDSGIINWEE
ncbi:MAG: formylglycine-generating enzyme family protein [Candidatus Omnitrophica bacterium]|nr:formylglycine-generating enzyme family protein [Candidatus Omnitrophota bacterium]